MDTACLQQGLESVGPAISSANLLIVLVMAFLCAVLLAPLLLWRYQKKVERLMKDRGASSSGRTAGNRSEVNPGADLPSADPAKRRGLKAAALMDGAKDHLHFASRALRRSALVFGGLSWLTLLLSSMYFETSFGGATQVWVEYSIYYLLLVMCVLTPLLVIETFIRRRRLWLVASSGVLFILLLNDLLSDSSIALSEHVSLIVFGAFMIGLIFSAIIGRRLRNVVPLITIGLSVVFLSISLMVEFFTIFDACEAEVMINIGIIGSLGLMWIVIRFGLRFVAQLGRAYERQQFSDTQFRIALWSLIVAVIFVIEATPDDDDVIVSAWALGIVVAYALGAFVYLRSVRSLTSWKDPQALLLLRVFSRDRQSQNLLDDISARWSFVGPIHLVGGPDLAKAYLEPHELLLFLQRRLDALFVLSRDDLADRLTRLELRADPDTRYRVNEFFCHDDTWRATVSALLGQVPVILLDLRGFTDHRKGTAYEIQLLAETGAMSRTVLLYDESTRESAVEKIIGTIEGARIDSNQIVWVDRTKHAVDAIMQRLSQFAMLD